MVTGESGKSVKKKRKKKVINEIGTYFVNQVGRYLGKDLENFFKALKKIPVSSRKISAHRPPNYKIKKMLSPSSDLAGLLDVFFPFELAGVEDSESPFFSGLSLESFDFGDF